MLDQVEGEVVGERGDVDELGEHQHGDNRHCTPHGTTRQAGGLLAGEGLEPGLAVAHGPAGHPQQHEYRQRGRQHEPGNGRLAVRNDDGSGQQRAEGRAGVATDLEGRLRGAEAPTGGHPGHSRSFWVEGRRAHADHRCGHQQHFIAAGEGEQGDAHQGHQHAGRQQVGLRVLVGVQADPGLQQGRGHLVDEGDPADLGKAQREIALEHRVDGWQHGLDQVVEQVGECGSADDADQKALGLVGRCGGGHGGGGGRHGRSSSGEREQGICRRRVASARFACLTPNRQPLSRFGHIH
ncbi:hypothetical protein D3C76_366770 [compost metagenome]